MSNTAPSRADPVVVFPLGRWCPPQETSQPHPPHVITEKNNCFINLLYGCGTYKGIYIIQHILHIMLLYTEAPPIDYPIHVDEIMFTNFRKQYFHEFIVA